MDNMNNINSLSFDTQNILNELQILIPQFNKFFNINDIFSSEIGGKTRLHRQIFNENNESIQESISRLNIQFDDFLSLIRQEMRNILAKYGEYEKSELTDLIFDDKNFIEILELNLDTKGITRDTKQKCLKDIKKLIHLKNKIFNLKYLVYMFDTSIFDKYINKLGVEDLINSTIIFEVSPRPHDTGMVTMITQSQSEFALHVRAVLGLPLEYIDYGCGASAAFKAKGDSFNPVIDIFDSSFTKDSIIRVFGKPQSHVGRRMAVALTFDRDSSDRALQKAKEIIGNFKDQ